MEQRVFPLDALAVEARELPGGGRVGCRQIINKGEPPRPDSRFFASALNTLEPASSVAWHQHPEDEEVFVILNGQGFYLDHQGQEHAVRAGDACFCLKGEKHGLRNPGPESLTYFALIVK